jgi:hypothetical protein
MSRCREFGASLPCADFLLLRIERLPWVNIQGDSQSRLIYIQLMSISSLFNLVKSPSPSCDEAAAASTKWSCHHSIARHYPRFASPFLFLPQNSMFGSIRPRSCLRHILPYLGHGLGAFPRFTNAVAPDQMKADFGMGPGSSEPRWDGLPTAARIRQYDT